MKLDLFHYCFVCQGNGENWRDHPEPWDRPDCDYCLGRGIPPIPMSELVGEHERCGR